MSGQVMPHVPAGRCTQQPLAHTARPGANRYLTCPFSELPVARQFATR